MSVLIADAAPLTFLDKIEGLGWLEAASLGRVWVPRPVYDEVMCSAPASIQATALVVFLERCRICEVQPGESFSSRLSHADSCVVTLAGKTPGSRILTDDG